MKNFILTILFLFMCIASAHADLRNGLVGWWKFDEASGNAIDTSISANTGTPTGTTLVSNCKKGGCRSLNGSSDFIDTNQDNGYDFSDTSFSVAAWFNTTSATIMMILGKSEAGNAAGWTVNTFADGSVGGGTKQAASAAVSASRVSSSTGLNDGKWHHVVVVITTDTVTTGNNTVTVYIDGILNQGALTQTGTYGPSTSNVFIGKRTTGNFFAGSLDDVRIYNRVLTAQEVRELYGPGVVLRNGVVRNGRINK